MAHRQGVQTDECSVGNDRIAIAGRLNVVPPITKTPMTTRTRNVAQCAAHGLTSKKISGITHIAPTRKQSCIAYRLIVALTSAETVFRESELMLNSPPGQDCQGTHQKQFPNHRLRMHKYFRRLSRPAVRPWCSFLWT